MNHEFFHNGHETVESQLEYTNSTLFPKLKRQLRDNAKAYTLFSDIDGTAIYKGGNLVHNQEQTKLLAEELEFNNIPLVLVTGRDIDLVKNNQVPNGDMIPLADVLCTDVGTTIHVLQKDGVYLQDSKYTQYVEDTVGFTRDQVYPISLEVRNAMQSEKPELELEYQVLDLPENKGIMPQSPHKISFRFNTVAPKVAEEIVQIFKDALNKQGLDKLVVLLSHDSYLQDGRTRYNIDLLPFTKDVAVQYMVEYYGTLAIVAGDSGNDEAMLLHGESDSIVASIIVGGSKPELIDAVKKATTTRKMYLEEGDAKGPESIRKALKELLSKY
jgi:hydroxymethylpyrimidine pyrophosphatase-like HAD family hydrolase